jgi:hypothetical protein
VVVRYRFHPRSGERINVIGINRYRGESYLIIMQPDGTRTHLPPWMTWDDAARMCIVAHPALPLEVLVELQRFVGAALSCLVLPTNKEANDAQSDGETAGSVRGSQQRRSDTSGTASGSGHATGVTDPVGNRRNRDGGA